MILLAITRLELSAINAIPNTSTILSPVLGATTKASSFFSTEISGVFGVFGVFGVSDSLSLSNTVNSPVSGFLEN